MATLNVGTMAARLGLDPSEFLDKMKGVQGFNGFVSGEMARQWKKTGRDGQEGLRLIDEALGIHVARPVARIVAETFPAFSQALSKMLPGVAFSALGVAIFEFAEGISRKVGEAKKAQQEYTEAVEHTSEVVGGMGAKHDRAMKEIALRAAELQGKPGAKLQELEFKVNSAAAEEAKKQLSEISQAMEKEAKAATAAAKWTTQFFGAIGYAWDYWMGNLKIDEANAKFRTFGHTLDGILQMHAGDPLAGLRAALKTTQAELSTTGVDIAKKLVAIQMAQQAVRTTFVHGAVIITRPDSGVDPDQLAKETQYALMLKAAIKSMSDSIDEALGKGGNDKLADAAERQLKAQQALASLQKSMSEGLGKLTPETDPIKKLETEIAGFRISAENDFRDVAESVASALETRTALARLEEYERRLDQVMLKAREDAELAKAVAGLPATMTVPSKAPDVSSAGAAPVLGAGGLSAAKFDTFAKDLGAQFKMAAEAGEQALTPQKKYALGVQELDLLVQKGLIDQVAYAAAVEHLATQFDKAAGLGEKLKKQLRSIQETQLQQADLARMKAADTKMLKTGRDPDGAPLSANDLAGVRLQMQEVNDQADKLLLKTGGINAGFGAWVHSLQAVESEGQFVFNALTEATKGFESTAADSLIKILESYHHSHEAMIHQLQKMWEGFFAGLAKTAIEHGLQSLMKPAGAGLEKAFPSLAPKASAASGLPANTSALATNTQALNAMTARMGAGGGGGGGISWTGGGANGGPASAGSPGGFIGDLSDSGSYDYGMAEGGDMTPGHTYLVGEEGPELFRSPVGGSITPNSKLGGGDTHIHYDMRGAVVTDDLMRKAEGARMMAASEDRSVNRAVSMAKENALRSRPSPR